MVAHAAPYPVPEDETFWIEFSAGSGTWTVPAGIHTITIGLSGEPGAGGTGAGDWAGRRGLASWIGGAVAVIPGQEIRIVNGASQDGAVIAGAGGAPGQWGECGTPGGRGGHSSSAWIDGTLLAVAAGGGGGGGSVAGTDGGAGGDADSDDAGPGGASAGGLGASLDASGLAGSDAVLCGGAGGGGGGGFRGGGGGGAAAGLPAGGGGGGVSYIDPDLGGDLTVGPSDSTSSYDPAFISYSLAMAAPPGVTVELRGSGRGRIPVR